MHATQGEIAHVNGKTVLIDLEAAADSIENQAIRTAEAVEVGLVLSGVRPAPARPASTALAVRIPPEERDQPLPQERSRHPWR